MICQMPCQKNNETNDMFLNDNADFSTFKDSVFELRTLAKTIDAGHDNVINATIGSLFDENKNSSFDTVYDCYNAVANSKNCLC